MILQHLKKQISASLNEHIFQVTGRARTAHQPLSSRNINWSPPAGTWWEQQTWQGQPLLQAGRQHSLSPLSPWGHFRVQQEPGGHTEPPLLALSAGKWDTNHSHWQHKISPFHVALLDPFLSELVNTARKLSICFFSFFSPLTTPISLPSAHTYRPECLLGSASTDNKCQHHKPHTNRPLTFYPQDPLLLHRTLAKNVC